jgi:uncharacterized RmlC-like cupin family protein
MIKLTKPKIVSVGWHLSDRQAQQASAANSTSLTDHLQPAAAGLLAAVRGVGEDVVMSEPVVVVKADALIDADPTAGMRRRRAIDVPGLWSGLVHTEPAATSGWHHHGAYQTSLYVVSGVMRLEFGPGGSSTIDAGPGDFIHVPAHAVHRESNPGQQPATAVITRAGSGTPTTNVDGPEPPTSSD